MTPSNTPQKCFDRWQRGVNRIISIHHRREPDQYASVFLSRSHCTNLIRSDPADPKPARQNNPDSVPGTGTFHPEEIYSALSDYLTYWYIYMTFAYIGLHLTWSPTSTLIWKSILKQIISLVFSFSSQFKLFGCTSRWYTAFVFAVTDQHAHIDPCFSAVKNSTFFIWCFLNYRCHKTVSASQA